MCDHNFRQLNAVQTNLYSNKQAACCGIMSANTECQHLCRVVSYYRDLRPQKLCDYFSIKRCAVFRKGIYRSCLHRWPGQSLASGSPAAMLSNRRYPHCSQVRRIINLLCLRYKLLTFFIYFTFQNKLWM